MDDMSSVIQQQVVQLLMKQQVGGNLEANAAPAMARSTPPPPAVFVGNSPQQTPLVGPQPVMPAASQPVMPAASQPVMPAASQPVMPAASQPVMSAASQPVLSHYMAPNPPSTDPTSSAMPSGQHVGTTQPAVLPVVSLAHKPILTAEHAAGEFIVPTAAPQESPASFQIARQSAPVTNSRPVFSQLSAIVRSSCTGSMASTTAQHQAASGGTILHKGEDMQQPISTVSHPPSITLQGSNLQHTRTVYGPTELPPPNVVEVALELLSSPCDLPVGEEVIVHGEVLPVSDEMSNRTDERNSSDDQEQGDDSAAKAKVLPAAYADDKAESEELSSDDSTGNLDKEPLSAHRKHRHKKSSRHSGSRRRKHGKHKRARHNTASDSEDAPNHQHTSRSRKKAADKSGSKEHRRASSDDDVHSHRYSKGKSSYERDDDHYSRKVAHLYSSIRRRSYHHRYPSERRYRVYSSTRSTSPRSGSLHRDSKRRYDHKYGRYDQRAASRSRSRSRERSSGRNRENSKLSDNDPKRKKRYTHSRSSSAGDSATSKQRTPEATQRESSSDVDSTNSSTSNEESTSAAAPEVSTTVGHLVAASAGLSLLNTFVESSDGSDPSSPPLAVTSSPKSTTHITDGNQETAASSTTAVKSSVSSSNSFPPLKPAAVTVLKKPIIIGSIPSFRNLVSCSSDLKVQRKPRAIGPRSLKSLSKGTTVEDACAKETNLAGDVPAELASTVGTFTVSQTMTQPPAHPAPTSHRIFFPATILDLVANRPFESNMLGAEGPQPSSELKRMIGKQAVHFFSLDCMVPDCIAEYHRVARDALKAPESAMSTERSPTELEHDETSHSQANSPSNPGRPPLTPAPFPTFNLSHLAFYKVVVHGELDDALTKEARVSFCDKDVQW